jgi:hypothetical protein
MRTRMVDATLLAALLLASSVGAPLAAQTNETAALRVRVTDAATGRPIEGAQVGFPDLGLFRLAAASGIAQILDIPPGPRTLEVTMLGYGKASRMILLEAHAVATGDIALTNDPIEIEGLTVTASAQIQRLRDVGYYDREKMGFGHHLGTLELSAIVATQPGDYFYKIPGVEVVAEAFGRKQVVSRRSCVTLSSFGLSAGPTTFGGNDRQGSPMPFVPAASPNAMATYLDGVRYRGAFDKIPTNTIEAIEVYVGSQVPMQFSQGQGGACGVILIWSKW